MPNFSNNFACNSDYLLKQKRVLYPSTECYQMKSRSCGLHIIIYTVNMIIKINLTVQNTTTQSGITAV